MKLYRKGGRQVAVMLCWAQSDSELPYEATEFQGFGLLCLAFEPRSTW